MSKVALYLQEHILGEVSYSPEVRKHFAQDASVLRMAPAIVVYPRNENDIRKTARFSWQLAERGRGLPITARGGGSDTSGAAIGSGILLIFPAHMNKILTLDPKKQFVTVEPGVTYDKLEQTLHTHGLFLPPYPASQQYATIGGGIANNAIGEKSVKYGSIAGYVESLRVVLANGEVIETKPLSKRELNRKMGQSTLEGEIYRGLDALLEENAGLINEAKKKKNVAFSSAGYNLLNVKSKSGFDLTPLFVGSQGTLGVITEATLEVEQYNPVTKLAHVTLESLEDLNEILPKITELKPSIFDMITRSTIDQIAQLNPNQLTSVIQDPKAAVHLFIEFDNHKDAARSKSAKQLKKIVDKLGGGIEIADKLEDQDKIRKIREAVATLLTHSKNQTKSVPVAEDVCISTENLVSFIRKASEVYASLGLVAPIWGSAGTGVVRMQPFLDLSQLGDRQKFFKLSAAIYKLVLDMDGSITAAAGDGRVRAAYTRAMHGADLHNVMLKVKKIFDPHGILNTGAKTASQEEIKGLMRGDYSLSAHHDHLPRS